MSCGTAWLKGAAVLVFLGVFLAPSAGEESHGAGKTAEAHMGKGYQYEQEERFEQAAEEFRAAVAANPLLLQARYQLAVCYFALRQLKEARAQFESLRTAAGSEPSVAYYLARLDLLEGSFASAIRRFQSIATDPPFPDTAYYLGSAYLAKGDWAEAERWLRKAAALTPRDFRVFDHLARAYQREGKTGESEKEFARAEVLRQQYNQTAREGLQCSQALETRPLAEARATCEKLFDPRDPDKLTTLGMLYGQYGDYEEAAGPLARAAALNPDSWEIAHDLGLTYFRLRRYTDALLPLEKAVRLRPEYFGSMALLGATLYALKQDKKAYEVLGRAHDLNPQNQDTARLLFDTSLLLAQGALADRNYAECLHYLQKAAQLRPDDAEVHRRLAEVYSLLGRKRQAELERSQARRLEN